MRRRFPSHRHSIDEETPLRSNDRTGQQRVVVTHWVAVVMDESGRRQFLGADMRTGAEFTNAPSNAYEFQSENAALHEAFTAKEQNKWITDVKAEPISVRKWVPVPKQG